MEVAADRYVYLAVALLMAGGLFTLVVERNLIKKLIGLILFQAAIFLFFVAGAAEDGATIPVVDPDRGVDVAYIDPLPHLLVLTALVVGASVVGVAAALLLRVQRAYGTLDDAELSNLTSADPVEGDAADQRGPAPALPPELLSRRSARALRERNSSGEGDPVAGADEHRGGP